MHILRNTVIIIYDYLKLINVLLVNFVAHAILPAENEKPLWCNSIVLTLALVLIAQVYTSSCVVQKPSKSLMFGNVSWLLKN